MKIVVAVESDKETIVRKTRKKDAITAEKAVRNYLNNNI